MVNTNKQRLWGALLAFGVLLWIFAFTILGLAIVRSLNRFENYLIHPSSNFPLAPAIESPY